MCSVDFSCTIVYRGNEKDLPSGFRWNMESHIRLANSHTSLFAVGNKDMLHYCDIKTSLWGTKRRPPKSQLYLHNII